MYNGIPKNPITYAQALMFMYLWDYSFKKYFNIFLMLLLTWYVETNLFPVLSSYDREKLLVFFC